MYTALKYEDNLQKIKVFLKNCLWKAMAYIFIMPS